MSFRVAGAPPNSLVRLYQTTSYVDCIVTGTGAEIGQAITNGAGVAVIPFDESVLMTQPGDTWFFQAQAAGAFTDLLGASFCP